MATILHQLEAESLTSVVGGLLQSKTHVLPTDVQIDEAKWEDLEKVIIGDDPEKFFQVGAQLLPQEKEELVEFLRRNVDVFAWDAYEAPGVDPNFIIPKKQTLRRPSKEHADAVRDKVMKLKHTRAIKEVFYPEWLANTVVVKKKNEKW